MVYLYLILSLCDYISPNIGFHRTFTSYAARSSLCSLCLPVNPSVLFLHTPKS